MLDLTIGKQGFQTEVVRMDVGYICICTKRPPPSQAHQTLLSETGTLQNEGFVQDCPQKWTREVSNMSGSRPGSLQHTSENLVVHLSEDRISRSLV